MAKTAYEKALEKQQRENQKIAVQEARRQYASTIVSGQPVVSGMRIMDAASEEVFAALLNYTTEMKIAIFKVTIVFFPPPIEALFLPNLKSFVCME